MPLERRPHMDSDQINVRNIPPEILQKAQEIAKLEDRTLSQVIRELLRRYVEENEHKLKPKKK